MSTVKRIFPPASEWLFFKIYVGKNMAENLIITLGKRANELIECKVIKKWFFIRYSDPNFHIRFRICCPLQNRMIVLDEFNDILSGLLSDRIIHNICIDCYHREIERYGEQTIEYVENLFCTDSYTILGILSVVAKESINSEEFKLKASILLIEKYFDIFNFSLKDRLSILEEMSSNMYLEFGFNNDNRKSLNELYRRYKDIVNSVYQNKEEKEVFLIESELNELHPNYAYLAEKLISVIGSDTDFLLKSLYSYIHMTMNRLWPDKNRMYELIVYDFLRRYYRGYIARKG